MNDLATGHNRLLGVNQGFSSARAIYQRNQADDTRNSPPIDFK